MKTRYYLISIFSLLWVITSSCEKESEAEHKEDNHEVENRVELTPTQFRIGNFQVGHVEERIISNVLRVNGRIVTPPQNLVDISAPFGGFVRQTDLLLGMPVYRGQVLAVMENPEFIQFQQDYLENLGKLEYLEKEYERQQLLTSEDVTPLRALQQTISELKMTRSRLGGLAERLRLLGVDIEKVKEGNFVSRVVITSPINGHVSDINVNVGKYVNPTDIMFRLVDATSVYVELSVFARDAWKLQQGQNVRFRLAGKSGQEFKGKVYLIGRTVDPQKGTLKVLVQLDRNDPILIQGTYINAMVEVGNHPVPSLPEEAVVLSEGKRYIFVKTKDVHKESKEKEHEHSEEKNHSEEEHIVFLMVEVGMGAVSDSFVELILPEDFDKNTEVVVKNAYTLLAQFKNAAGGGEEGHAH